MIDPNSKGIKCRAVRSIRCYQGTIGAATEGTSEYEFENFGRRLINVHWNNGISLNVFPGEIEIICQDFKIYCERCD
jgi:hypothetical protein